MNKVKVEDIKPFWTPKVPPVKAQCKACPFGPQAHLLNDSEEAIAHAKQTADMGMDFFCHCTVYQGALVNPNPPMQPRNKWKTCAGMVKYKQDKEIQGRAERLREQGLLIE